MIIVVPDQNILANDNFYDFGARTMCEMAIKWLVHEINAVVLARKEGMKQVCKGLVCSSKPKIIYIHMIHHPARDPQQAIHHIFNKANDEKNQEA